MLKNVDLDKLKVLHAVQSTQSLAKASSLLNVTPSAVSQSIQALEEQLQMQLFIRSGKKYFTTAIGKRIVDLFLPFFENLEAEVYQASKNKERVAGYIRIHSPNNLARSSLSKIICDFTSKYPEVNVNLQLGSPSEGQELLLSNNVGFAFCDEESSFFKDKRVHRKFLYSDSLALVCSHKFYKLNINGNETFKCLSSLPHILSTNDQKSLKNFYKKSFKKTTNLKGQLITYDLQVILDAVKNHLGLAIAPMRSISKEISNGTLVKVTKKQVRYSKYVSWLRGRELTSAESKFLDALFSRLSCQNASV